jgi:hypothetical protein
MPCTPVFAGRNGTSSSDCKTPSYSWSMDSKSGTCTSALMFVMGLDMLFMAGELRAFMERVGGFFGLDTLVFPTDSLLGRQPNTTVGGVLQDVYDLRNVIAHRQPIPKQPYLHRHDLISTSGEVINHEAYSYAELMLEASLFLLTTALRRIFIEGRYEDVADITKWRAQLTVYEHRYKDARRPNPTKARGR